MHPLFSQIAMLVLLDLLDGPLITQLINSYSAGKQSVMQNW